jgi:hypothetical protein
VEHLNAKKAVKVKYLIFTVVVQICFGLYLKISYIKSILYPINYPVFDEFEFVE